MSLWDRLRGRRQHEPVAPEPEVRSTPQVPVGLRRPVRVSAGWAELDAALAEDGDGSGERLDALAARITNARAVSSPEDSAEERSTHEQGVHEHHTHGHHGHHHGAHEPAVQLALVVPGTAQRRWEERSTAEAFVAGVGALARALESRGAAADLWVTLVRPWATIVAAGGDGAAAGGDSAAHSAAHDEDGPLARPPWTYDEALPARAHHACLAHGLAAEVLRREHGTPVAVELDLAVHTPADEERGADLDAVHAADVLRNHLLVGPLLEGALPRDLAAATHLPIDLTAVRPGDLARTRAPLAQIVLTPPQTWVLSGTVGHTDVLTAPVEARRSDPQDAAQALHDQLRAFDVAHEGTPLAVDLALVTDEEQRTLLHAAVQRALADLIPVVLIEAPDGADAPDAQGEQR